MSSDGSNKGNGSDSDDWMDAEEQAEKERAIRATVREAKKAIPNIPSTMSADEWERRTAATNVFGNPVERSRELQAVDAQLRSLDTHRSNFHRQRQQYVEALTSAAELQRDTQQADRDAQPEAVRQALHTEWQQAEHDSREAGQRLLQTSRAIDASLTGTQEAVNQWRPTTKKGSNRNHDGAEDELRQQLSTAMGGIDEIRASIDKLEQQVAQPNLARPIAAPWGESNEDLGDLKITFASASASRRNTADSDHIDEQLAHLLGSDSDSEQESLDQDSDQEQEQDKGKGKSKDKGKQKARRQGGDDDRDDVERNVPSRRDSSSDDSFDEQQLQRGIAENLRTDTVNEAGPSGPSGPRPPMRPRENYSDTWLSRRQRDSRLVRFDQQMQRSEAMIHGRQRAGLEPETFGVRPDSDRTHGSSLTQQPQPQRRAGSSTTAQTNEPSTPRELSRTPPQPRQRPGSTRSSSPESSDSSRSNSRSKSRSR